MSQCTPMFSDEHDIDQEQENKKPIKTKTYNHIFFMGITFGGMTFL